MGVPAAPLQTFHKEVEQRYENRKCLRIRKATFPQMKYLQELVREDLPADDRNLLPEFETLNFIRVGRNDDMYGMATQEQARPILPLGWE